MPVEYKRSTKKKLTFEQLQDITLPVSMELGHKLMRVKDLLELTPGRIVKLDRLAGEFANEALNQQCRIDLAKKNSRLAGMIVTKALLSACGENKKRERGSK